MDKELVKKKDYTYVPYWVTSFDQLDSVEAANEVEEALYELLYQYVDLVTNVMRYGNFIQPDLANFTYDSTYAVDQIQALTRELMKRLGRIPALDMLKEAQQQILTEGSSVLWSVLDKEGQIQDQPTGIIEEIITDGSFENLTASENSPVYKVKSETGASLYKHSGQLRKTNSVIRNNVLSLYKDKEDLRWFGIVTNIYQDSAEDILVEKSHLNFIEMVEKGEASYPELWVWHIEKPVGTTDWIGYDDRGFVIASGLVQKDYEELVTNLVTNTPNMGMSHGMPIDSLHYEDKYRIDRYVSKEYSLLPTDSAANKLTYYIIKEDESSDGEL